MTELALDTPTTPPLPKPEGGRPAAQQDLATITPEVRERLRLTQSEDGPRGYVSARHTSSGADVKWWQEQINEFRKQKGLPPIAVSGTVDPATTDAIKQMQRDLGVADDGVIGPRTFRAFMREMFNVAKDAVIEVGHAIFTSFKNKFGFDFLSEEAYRALLAASSERKGSFTRIFFGDLKNLSGREVFERGLEFTKQFEGWFSDHPSDRGGVTLAGVTWRVYRHYLSSKGRDVSRAEAEAELREYSKKPRDEFLAIAKEIFYQEYWTKGGCDKLPARLAIAHFDACINHGVGGAGELLRKTLAGLDLNSLEGLSEEQEKELVKAYQEHRRNYYKSIIANNPSQEDFRTGWFRRANTLESSLMASFTVEISGKTIELKDLPSAGTARSQQLASVADNDSSRLDGMCARGVRIALEAVGLSPNPTNGSGPDAKCYIPRLANSREFAEVVQGGRPMTLSEAERAFKDVPGVVIVYPSATDPNHAGHICVSGGDGFFYADGRSQSLLVRRDKYTPDQIVRAFIPV